MPISFTPALGEALHFPVPEWYRDTSTELRFSAILDDEEFLQFKHGMRVQIWSDCIPFGRGGQGEWGEIDFHEDPQASSIADGSAEPGVSLVPDNYVEERPRNVLSAAFSVSAEGHPSRHFSFTYRLVYPSGEVKWLGAFGSNGSISISSKSASSILLEEGWSTDLGSLVWNTRERVVEDLLIARIAHPKDWTFWAIGKDSFLLDSTQSASLLLLVPNVRPNAVYCPKTLVLSASSDASVSLDASGELRASGSGSLLLQIYDSLSSADSFIDKVFAHSPTLDSRLLGVFSNYVALASTPTASVVQAVLVPLIPSGFISQIVVASASLGSILGTGTGTPGFTIFAPVRSSVQFVDPLASEPAFVTFLVPPSGALFILTPLYPISTGKQEAGSDIQVSVLSPHMDARSSADDALPTPPPSPHLHPIAHLTVQTSDVNASDLSISELGEQDIQEHNAEVQGTLISESNSYQTIRPSHAPLVRQRSSTSLVESYRENSSNFVVAFMRHLYLACSLWMFAVLHRLFRSSAAGNDPERSPPSSPLSDAADETVDSDTATGASSSPLNERTPLLSRVVPTIVTTAVAVEPPLQGSAEAPSPSPPQSPLARPLTFDILDTKPGPHRMIVRNAGGSIDNLAVEMNGQAVSFTDIKTIGEGIYHLGIEWQGPGRMTIRPKLFQKH